MAEPNSELIRRAQTGDRVALGELVASQQHYVYSLALSLMKSPSDAADLTQDAFVRLIRGLPWYRGETRFSTWLYRLVVNLGLDHLRRSGRRVDSLEAEVESSGFEVPDPSVESDPLAAMTQEEAAQRVREAVLALSVPQRLALTMHYFDDLGYQEIADVMGVPLNTVKSHIRRGKQRLTWLLREYGPSEALRPFSFERTEIAPPPACGGIEGG